MAPFKQKRIMAHLKPEAVAARMGRPSEYKPEYCQMVIEHMSKGKSLTAFAGSIRMGREAIYEWINTYPDFGDAVTRGRSARVDALEDKMLGAQKSAEAATSIFALKNADPYEWREVRYAEYNHNIQVTALDDEQLLAIASGADPSHAGIIDGKAKRIVTPAADPVLTSQPSPSVKRLSAKDKSK